MIDPKMLKSRSGTHDVQMSVASTHAQPIDSGNRRCREMIVPCTRCRGTVCNDGPIASGLIRTVAEYMRSQPAASLTGHSSEINRVRMAFERLAACDFTVVIRGESGTGKESSHA
jgi:transcriptional regulator of acetoin/glycerol metabolism